MILFGIIARPLRWNFVIGDALQPSRSGVRPLYHRRLEFRLAGLSPGKSRKSRSTARISGSRSGKHPKSTYKSTAMRILRSGSIIEFRLIAIVVRVEIKDTGFERKKRCCLKERCNLGKYPSKITFCHFRDHGKLQI